MHGDIQHVLLDQQTIARRVAEMAAQLSKDLAGREVLMVGVLKGSFCFLADLMRAMTIPVSIDFVACSSYGSGASSSGRVRISKDLSQDPRGKALVVVEDIVDTGLTLRDLMELLAAKEPASLHTVTLLDKPSRRKIDVAADYYGFVIADEFVVGYGLDYAERYRQLPYIGVLKPEIYS